MTIKIKVAAASLNPRWLILRGVLSIIFGVLAFAWPGPGLLAIALLFGAYAFVDGVCAIGTAFERGRKGWALPVLEGAAGIATGVVTAFWPAITVLILSILTGTWALVTGALELIAAASFRGTLGRPSLGARIFLGIAGLLSVALGVLIFASPALGAVALLTWIAGYSLFFGVLMVSLGARLTHQARERAKGEERSVKAA